MTFSVRPGDFYMFQAQLKVLSDQVAPGKTYAQTHVALTDRQAGRAGGVLWADAIKSIREVSAAVTKNLDRLKELVDASALEVVRSATMYSRTDQATAERLDQTYLEQP